MSYNYLASPYTHNSLDIMEQRYLLTCEALVWLLDRKIWTYSPIVHCHEIAKQHTLPRHSSYWREYNRVMLKDAAGFIILTIEGWDESVGLKDEMEYAEKRKILTKFLHRRDANDFLIRSTQ